MVPNVKKNDIGTVIERMGLGGWVIIEDGVRRHAGRYDLQFVCKTPKLGGF